MQKQKDKQQIKRRSFLASTAILFCMLTASGLTSIAGAKSTSTTMNTVTTRVELDRSVLPTGGPQRAVLKITLDASPPPTVHLTRPAVNLAIVLDRSGSMAGSKLEKAKEAAIVALRRLSPNDLFSLVIYDHSVQTIVPAQSAARAEWIEGRIRSIRPGGNTALFGGVSQGAAEIRKNLDRPYVHRLILLSDGLANVGPSSPSDLGRLGASLSKEHISVTTIGVGTDYNEDLMTRLSQRSDGNSYFVESSYDLPRIFNAELGDVLNVVAQDVQIIIYCPTGVVPLNIIGREGRIKNQRVEFSMNQLYGNQEKYILVEVEVPAGTDGKSIEIARTDVSYTNPFTRSRQKSQAQASIKYSSNKGQVQQSVNLHVQRELQYNQAALAQDQAITLADEGKKKKAIATLRASGVQMRAYAEQHQDKEVMQKAEEMEEQAAAIARQGMTKRSRKILRSQAYQTINQQKEK